jgi:hypothetical protein
LLVALQILIPSLNLLTISFSLDSLPNGRLNKEITMLDDRTIYTIQDAGGEKTTITLEKLVADVLQELLPDVHDWVQNTYDRVAAKRPELGRRQKGDLVRLLSVREAEKSPRYKELLDELFGL